MYQNQDNGTSNQEHTLTRRKLLVRTSVVAGAAAVAAVGGGFALKSTHAAGNAADATPSSSLAPAKLYRLNNGQDYLYLPETADLKTAHDKYGYKVEGLAGYVYTTQVGNTSPVFRWNNGKEHFYTADPNERPNGYTKEGIQFYA
jgi:hypothetical protein